MSHRSSLVLLALALSGLVFSPSHIRVHAAAFVSMGGTASWNEPANWNPPGVPNGPTASAIFETPTSARTIELDAPITVGTITFDNNANFANSLNDGAAGSLTLGAAGSGATITATGTGTGLSSVRATMSLPETVTVNIANTVGLASAAGSAISLTGAMNGPGGLTKTGDGVMTIAAIPGSTEITKLFTGPTSVEAGRLRFSPIGAPIQSSSVRVSSGGQLFLIPSSASTDFVFGGSTLTLNGFGLPPAGPFSVTSAGALRYDTTSSNFVTTNNPVALSSDSSIFIQINNTFTLRNTVSGPGALIKVGAGILVLEASNSYAGGTAVNEGALVAGAANASLGTGNVTVENSAIQLTIQTGVINAIADSGTLTLLGGGAPAFADNGFLELGAGVNEIVGTLVLDTATQPLGTYGSSASAATFRNDEYFSGPGILTVIPEPGCAALLFGGFSVLLGGQRFSRRTTSGADRS